MTSIKSFEELVNSNLTIIGGKYSHFENFDKSLAGLEILKKLHNRTNFVHDYNVS
jgi:predicted signal transduction protein with EAL and GGDEF domain